MGRRPPYYDGKVHVMAEQCDTCIFRPGNLMDLEPGRVAGMIREARANDSCIPCHETIYGQAPQEAVCRGFFDRHATMPLRLAIAMNVIEEVTPHPPTKSSPAKDA